jgi:hypothetical protein
MADIVRASALAGPARQSHFRQVAFDMGDFLRHLGVLVLE